jgi:hypothetical protein
MALFCPVCGQFSFYEVVDFLPERFFLAAKPKIHGFPYPTVAVIGSRLLLAGQSQSPHSDNVALNLIGAAAHAYRDAAQIGAHCPGIKDSPFGVLG